MSSLKHTFPGIAKNGRTSYGGSQSWSRSGVLRRYGCGVVSGTDLLLYLHLYHKNGENSLFSDLEQEEAKREEPAHGEPQKKIPLERYLSWTDQIRKKYLPVLPGFGLNGFVLAFGLNRIFRKNQIPYRARWGVLGRQLWRKLDGMLALDLPVILSVGPNFPFIWRKQKLTFYIRTAEGTYAPSTGVKAHYVTATAADQEWVQISSWGRRYFINKKDYEDYVKKYSSFLVSNLVLLREKRHQ